MVLKRETKAIVQLVWITTVQDWTVSFFPKCLYIIVLCKEENSFFNELIHTIQIFMRKYFVVQHYPQNIFNIELFPNYGNHKKFLKDCNWNS